METTSSLSFRLHALVYAMDAMAEREVTRHARLSFPQFLVLLCIHQQPDTDQKYMAGWLRVTEATVSYMVKKLAAAGLVVAAKSDADTRRKVINLTAKGRRLVETLHPRLEESAAGLFAVLPAARRAQFERDVDMLNRAIDDRLVDPT